MEDHQESQKRSTLHAHLCAHTLSYAYPNTHHSYTHSHHSLSFLSLSVSSSFFQHALAREEAKAESHRADQMRDRLLASEQELRNRQEQLQTAQKLAQDREQRLQEKDRQVRVRMGLQASCG